MAASLGMKPGDDYIDLPYLEGWTPHSDRAWALAFIDEDGTEDYQSFKQAYLAKYPAMEMPGGFPCSIPASVDDYLRVDRFGRRRDIDWDLASLPRSEEEIEEMKAARNRVKKQRRLDALRSRGIDAPASEQEIADKMLASEKRKVKSVGERMRDGG